jgi:hypothetical protein
MKLKELTNITLEDIYWRLKAGKSTKRLTVFELRSDLNKYIKNPVFFLSTGRCGTKWFSDLLSQNKKLFVLHSPVPNLAIQSKLAYEIFKTGNLKNSHLDLLQEIFLTGREQHLRYSFKTDKRYIETNNYITFFAPILIELFPDAKFVHLYRHPGEFVRSAIRRNYYTKNNPENLKRIVPLDGQQKEQWEQFSQLEKTAWLWNETNLFIEQFKEKKPEKVFDFNFNDLTIQNINSLLQFLDITIKNSTITKSLTVKSNIQKKGYFPKYENWNEQDKKLLKTICNEYNLKYTNYKL